MIEFISVTSKLLQQIVPNIMISNVDYSSYHNVITMTLTFFDTKFNKLSIGFTYYDETPIVMNSDKTNLEIEFTKFANKLKEIIV